MSMPSRTGSFIGDVIASASGLLILLFVLIALDERVREQLMLFASGEPRAAEFAGWGHGLLGLSLVIPQLARLENTHLLVFAVVAVVLVTCLLRL
jgi:hypothetical protein